jgi:phthalate 4,5-cis-dihydrodiol dehydrogenase
MVAPMVETAEVRIAIIGYGLAVAPVVKSLLAHGSFAVVACVDPDPLARSRFVERTGGTAYETAPPMLEAERPDVVYIATPTRTHEELTLLAFSHGADVLVEKPIATSMPAAERMVAAAAGSGRVLMVNHKRSADREVLAMRAAIRSGEIGTPRLTNRWYGTNWMFRPRAEEERDPEFGGVVLRQGAHEFDILRALIVSPPTRVRAWVGDLVQDRPGEGAYYAWIECADGTAAISVYNGYDRFLTDELTAGPLSPMTIGASHRQHAENAAAGLDEYDLKRTVGHPRDSALIQDMYGFSFAMCEHGDVRTAPGGAAWVYGRGGRRQVTVDGPAGTDFVIDELHRALAHGEPPAHDGMWGLACLELCAAVRTAAASGEFVTLHHQGSPDTARFASDATPLIGAGT